MVRRGRLHNSAFATPNMQVWYGGAPSSTASLSVVPEPHAVIFDELFVRPFVLHCLNRDDGSLDATPALMAAHEQAIDCEIRTLLEREQTLYREIGRAHV